MSEDYDAFEYVCAALGPPPTPEGLGYLCSLPFGHDGAHEAWVDGSRRDSWGAEA